jgi:uncharacterized RDD family membrane protein YckC
VTNPAEQQPPVPGPGYPPNYGYPAPPAAYPGYGYPPGGFRAPVPVAPGGAPLAEFWRRLLAYLIDVLVVAAVLFIPVSALFALLFMSYAASFDSTVPPDPFRMLLVELVVVAAVLPLNLIASYVYFVVIAHKTGQTVGKRVMKLRIVRGLDGGPVDLRILRRRWVVQHLSAIVAGYFNLADGLWQLWDKPYRQCLHDKCAETVVVQVAA